MIYTKLVAASWSTSATNIDSGIYTSNDSGASWARTSAPSGTWVSVVSSADGVKLAAALVGADPYPGFSGGPDYYSSSSLIYASTDGGVSWAPTGAPLAPWRIVASSADGAIVIAGGNGSDPSVVGSLDLIVSLTSEGAALVAQLPRLSMGPSGPNLVLSWLVPSTRFVLQQTSDLAPPNWEDVTNQPTLNFTNLHQEMTLTPESRLRFYRLKQQ
jgi:hypothetical protein